MRRTPFKPRTRSLARHKGLVVTVPLRARKPLERLRKPAQASRETGFPRAVKKAIRERAGNRCEACGVPCPPGYGNVQHRLARKNGGRHGVMCLVVNSITNAVLLCGTPFTGCHGACEDRSNKHMHAMGFRLKEDQNPAAEPIMLHGEFGGALVWLTADGGYSTEPPSEPERRAA